MIEHKQNIANKENISSWIRSNRLYEQILFAYIVILTFWASIGFFTLGFELEGKSLQYSLFANFCYFIILAIGMAFTPFWHKILFNRKSQLQKRNAITIKHLDTIKDEQQRNAIKQYLINDGALPPRKSQQWALIFLGWCFLFEILFVTSWVKDMALVWQPDWVNNIVHWVQVNTKNLTTEGVEVNRLFLLYFGDRSSSSGENILKTMFSSENEFLSSELGKACLLFHAWHALSFFPILVAYTIIFWQVIGWTGGNKVDAKNEGGIKDFLWLIIVTFFMTLLLIAGFGILFEDISYRSLSVIDKYGWVQDSWLNIGYFFVIVALRVYVSWFFFFKNLMLRIYRKFVSF